MAGVRVHDDHRRGRRDAEDAEDAEDARLSKGADAAILCHNRVLIPQSMTPDDFRRIALGMTEAIEGAHMGHPDFRANGKIFATLYPDGRHGMVKLTPDQQQEFIRANPEMFEPASGAWGRQGCTTVLLAAADEDVVGEAMTLAWRESAKTPPARRSRAKRAITPRRPARKRR